MVAVMEKPARTEDASVVAEELQEEREEERDDPQRVLVFAPHPDDETLGCGGSIAKHLRLGREVYVVYAGDTSEVDCSFLSREEYARRQQVEIDLAGRALGLKEGNWFILNENPGNYRKEVLRQEFLNILRQVKPQICYLPHVGDAHPDHRVVHEAAVEAVNWAPSPWFCKYGGELQPLAKPVRYVLAYEVWTPLEASGVPNYFESLTEKDVEIAMSSLRERKTQETWKYEPAYRGRVALRAAMHEGPLPAEHAEAFQILKCTAPLFG